MVVEGKKEKKVRPLEGAQVSRLPQDFLSSATSTESAQREYKNVEMSDSKIAKGVMDRIVRF